MQSLTNARTTCAMVAHSASLKRVFWKSQIGWPNALRSFVYSSVSSTARSIAAAAGTQMQQPLVRQLAHQLEEALALLLAEQVVGRHAHVVEEQLGGVLRHAGPSCRAAADAEARQVLGLDHDQRHAAAAGVAGAHGHHQQVGAEAVGDEGLGAVDRRSRRRRARRACAAPCRSEPAPGSVIAIAGRAARRWRAWAASVASAPRCRSRECSARRCVCTAVFAGNSALASSSCTTSW